MYSSNQILAHSVHLPFCWEKEGCGGGGGGAKKRSIMLMDLTQYVDLTQEFQLVLGTFDAKT